MLISNFESWSLGILAMLVMASVILFHCLLVRNYLAQAKSCLKKLQDLQNSVNLQIEKASSLSSHSGDFQVVREQTEEKLELIRLQVEAMSKVKKPD